ncbi:MAG: UDP-2,3-diacylglucosamine diphosphatase [Gammaproteobacteria bacterium]|nr:UDP-2,3-diacylglucosamine diphosphatase [Gammaproteobacteria bacterium]
MATAFISDLHLSSNHPEMIALFLNFLETYTTQLETLYILGDFFDVWIGDDATTDADDTVIQALKRATDKGLKIYFMHGNRDFLVGKNFFKMTGCIFLKDPCVIELYGKRILLMHGDTLCTQDIAYLKFRKKTRNWFVKKLFLLKSRNARNKIATGYRKASQMHTQTKAENIMDVTPEEVLRVMEKHHVQTLIHGHTHRPGIHAFLLNQQPATRIVLPAWHEQDGAFFCKPDGSQTFVTSGKPLTLSGNL